jgi:two-component system sensor histidine kinase CreC
MKRMSVTLRLFLIGSALVAASGWVALVQVLDEIKPAVRQSTEETLVDTANLLAEIVAPDLRDGTLAQGDLARILSAYGQRRPGASIWGMAKDRVTHRLYVTDARGIVVVDSTGLDIGKDYSRWNDVYRTLHGQYGARTTQDVPGDENTTVMYVAAPVRGAGNIIGVVTVAKPNRSVQPFIERAQQRLSSMAGVLIAAGIAVGALMSWWLSRSIRRLTRYADAVTAGERPALPDLPGSELNQLATALDTMRARLEGKAYVERYVQTLTHELKSPLAAIRSATELLGGEMPSSDRTRFLTHIDVETARLQSLSERLLNLAQVEQRRDLEERQAVAVRELVAELILHAAPRLSLAGVQCGNAIDEGSVVFGERFLLRQALLNLIDNAVDFTPRGGHIRISTQADELNNNQPAVRISVFNEGEPIPGYALPRVTERFYSLARPGTGRKSTGLGLNFVLEAAHLHAGRFHIANVPGGVLAELVLPAS